MSSTITVERELALRGSVDLAAAAEVLTALLNGCTDFNVPILETAWELQGAVLPHIREIADDSWVDDPAQVDWEARKCDRQAEIFAELGFPDDAAACREHAARMREEGSINVVFVAA
jgi:hypothetical protein